MSVQMAQHFHLQSTKGTGALQDTLCIRLLAEHPHVSPSIDVRTHDIAARIDKGVKGPVSKAKKKAVNSKEANKDDDNLESNLSQVSPIIDPTSIV